MNLKISEGIKVFRLLAPERNLLEMKTRKNLELGVMNDKRTQSIISLKSVKENLLINRFLNSPISH